MTGKLLLLVALLGFVALLLGTGVLTLQLVIVNERNNHAFLQQQQKPQSPRQKVRPKQEEQRVLEDDENPDPPVHVPQALDLQRKVGHEGASPIGAANAYWNQLVAFSLASWDAVAADNEDAQDFMKWQSTKTNRENLRPLLPLAAKLGHPQAQHYWAVSLASGIWPLSGSHISNGHNTSDTLSLKVLESFEPEPFSSSASSSSSGGSSSEEKEEQRQLQQAYLYWRMAAMGGNAEAAMALAQRGASSSFLKNPHVPPSIQSSCIARLPYYRVAANKVMDDLYASKQSRGKILPPQDKHYLAQVHLHGGTSSQLEWNNKPPESKEALQFYHFKATSAQDLTAATTLATLYHYGYRGVPQNTTKALEYWELAASLGSWEAAGQAGMMYFFGIGCEKPDIWSAWEYFELGTGMLGLDKCRRRHDQMTLRTKQKQQEMAAWKRKMNKQNGENEDEDDEDDRDSFLQSLLDVKGNIVQCDSRALTGLGLVYLFGSKEWDWEVDLELAEKYLALAKEMGHAEAYYYLAMIWLGWKTHYRPVDELSTDGTSSMDHADTAFPESARSASASTNPHSFALHKSFNKDSVFKGPTQREVTEAIKLLTTAANKGHLESKHRLALIWSQGITLRGIDSSMDYPVVKPDCARAQQAFEWIWNEASPTQSARLRTAYRQYEQGQLESAVRNYLLASETGSPVGQANAAFLLERGTCLDLSTSDCAKASVRLWKAAAAQGHAEACLRVGDFYYYGRMREGDNDTSDVVLSRPFGWVQALIYPEKYIPDISLQSLSMRLVEWLESTYGVHLIIDSQRKEGFQNKQSLHIDEKQPDDSLQHDLAMAAHYYTIAVEKHNSPRANFNLGFLHQWGLGVSQDFPLAKRHYDLAISGNTQEGELAVTIGLFCLSIHEAIVKWEMAVWDWLDGKLQNERQQQALAEEGGSSDSPRMAADRVGEPVPTTVDDRTVFQVVIAHLLQWDTALLVFLVALLYRVAEIRLTRNR